MRNMKIRSALDRFEGPHRNLMTPSAKRLLL
jgi:hypothetical protein